jgi:hypothetical protein
VLVRALRGEDGASSSKELRSVARSSLGCLQSGSVLIGSSNKLIGGALPTIYWKIAGADWLRIAKRLDGECRWVNVYHRSHPKSNK